MTIVALRRSRKTAHVTKVIFVTLRCHHMVVRKMMLPPSHPADYFVLLTGMIARKH